MIKKANIQLLLFFILIMTQNKKSCAQGFSFEPKGSFTLDIGIPLSEKNYAFNYVLEGLFNGGIGYQYNVYEGLTVGIGAKYAFFINDRFALNSTVGKGGLHIPSVFLKVGYEKFTTDRFSYTFSMRGGFSKMISINDSSKINLGKPYTENTFFVEPQLELLMTTDKNDPNAFSLILGYAIYFSNYRPEYLSRENFSGLNKEDSEGVTRFFSFGFGYRYYFGLN